MPNTDYFNLLTLSTFDVAVSVSLTRQDCHRVGHLENAPAYREGSRAPYLGCSAVARMAESVVPIAPSGLKSSLTPLWAWSLTRCTTAPLPHVLHSCPQLHPRQGRHQPPHLLYASLCPPLYLILAAPLTADETKLGSVVHPLTTFLQECLPI